MDEILELGPGDLVDMFLDYHLGSGTHGWGLEGHDKGLQTASAGIEKKGRPVVFFC